MFWLLNTLYCYQTKVNHLGGVKYCKPVYFWLDNIFLFFKENIRIYIIPIHKENLNV